MNEQRINERNSSKGIEKRRIRLNRRLQTSKKAFFSKELEESMTEIDIPECTDFDFSFLDEGEDNV